MFLNMQVVLWIVAAEGLAATTKTPGKTPPPTKHVEVLELPERGVSLPCIRYEGGGGRRVLLIHGTFHDARCYDEYWLPELAKHCEPWAVSLRGTDGATPATKVKLSDHVDDLREVLRNGEKWYVVAHSFGGPIAMELLRTEPAVEAIAVLCSVPPTGNFAMTFRTLKRSLRTAWVITKGFAMKTAATSLEDARRLFFFKSNVTDANLAKYVAWFKENSLVSLDLRDFQKHLPARYRDPKTKEATFLTEKKHLVLGAGNDLIVDDVAVRETATFLGVDDPVVLRNAPHDVMLDPDQWKLGLDAVVAWLDKQP